MNGPAPGRVRPVADETTSAYEAFLDRLDLSPDFNALEARDTLRRLLEKESYWRTRLAHAQDTILRRRAERRIDELEVEIGSLWSIVHPPVVEGEDPPPGAIARARCRYCGTGIEERLQTECATCGAGWSKPPTT